MRFIPAKAQIYGGVVYSAEPVLVFPDDKGNFAVDLPPGRYTVEMPTWVLDIDVPPADTAKLEEIVCQA